MPSNKINPSIFKAYDIRGIYPTEINPEAAYIAAWAFGKYLKADLKLELPIKVAVGLHMRGSSPFLAREVARALNDRDTDVVDLGFVPTPAFYYAVAFQDFSGGVMVTASHQPKEYNGLKLCAENAVPVATGKSHREFFSAAWDRTASRQFNFAVVLQCLLERV